MNADTHHPRRKHEGSKTRRPPEVTQIAQGSLPVEWFPASSNAKAPKDEQSVDLPVDHFPMTEEMPGLLDELLAKSLAAPQTCPERAKRVEWIPPLVRDALSVGMTA